MAMAFRIAGISAALRHFEADAETLRTNPFIAAKQDDVSAGLMLGLTFLDHAAQMLSRLDGRSRLNGLTSEEKRLLSLLPSGNFYTSKAHDIAQEELDMINRTADRKLKMFAKEGLIEKVKRGLWRKPPPPSERVSLLECYVQPKRGAGSVDSVVSVVSTGPSPSGSASNDESEASGDGQSGSAPTEAAV
jgi:hypothetical protein